ncbi:hypothetical protein KCU61_g742, partial [Aureobasidium melanogenum]
MNALYRLLVRNMPMMPIPTNAHLRPQVFFWQPASRNLRSTRTIQHFDANALTVGQNPIYYYVGRYFLGPRLR